MKILTASAIALSFAIVTPAAAQMDMNMPGMQMPSKPKPKSAKPKPAKPKAAKPKATTASSRPAPAAKPAPSSMPDHDMSSMPGMDMAPMPSTPNSPQSTPKPKHDMSSMPGMEMATPGSPAPADPQAGHDMSSMAGMPGMETPDVGIGDAPAPAPPTDHAADALFGAERMTDSRAMLRHENGGVPAYSVIFNLAEYRVQKGKDAYRWDGEGWFGGDIDRFVVKTEGEGALRGGVESAEVQALYSRAIGPWFNLQAGVRQDFKPGPARTYATVGFEGIAPYWFKVNGALFLSDKGDLLGRLEGYYDERITQKLILQPRVELNFAAQDVPANGIGSGLSDAELGLRLRYEIKREFAPYIGVSWERKFGDSARFARIAGDRIAATSLVIGIRTWF
jgi:copper resistance protein B